MAAVGWGRLQRPRGTPRTVTRTLSDDAGHRGEFLVVLAARNSPESKVADASHGCPVCGAAPLRRQPIASFADHALEAVGQLLDQPQRHLRRQPLRRLLLVEWPARQRVDPPRRRAPREERRLDARAEAPVADQPVFWRRPTPAPCTAGARRRLTAPPPRPLHPAETAPAPRAPPAQSGAARETPASAPCGPRRRVGVRCPRRPPAPPPGRRSRA